MSVARSEPHFTLAPRAVNDWLTMLEAAERREISVAKTRTRLDDLLVELGYFADLRTARGWIMAGKVVVDEKTTTAIGLPVAQTAQIHLRGLPLKYASRGGYKLAHALEVFGVDVRGKVALDAGASTGGFTDCLLQAGAARVHSIDVGTGQLDWKLRNDGRVVVREGINARYLDLADLGEPVDLAVCDVSFISATLIMPAMVRVLKPATGRMVLLVKPQFEVGKGQVGKGGIVRDPAQHAEVCEKLRTCAAGLGFQTDLMESPITGAEGNREFLLYAYRSL
jgi:23S rRNA (cytidine1920-2'-O)/16S rRNA (cytidine1409-2'-O)-methyltransferase